VLFDESGGMGRLFVMFVAFLDLDRDAKIVVKNENVGIPIRCI